MIMSKQWWKCAGVRAIKTTAQTMVSLIPVGFVVTPTMLQDMNWSVLYVILAWLLTGLFSGACSLLTSLGGLPELESED
jgi:uncharacterized membrane protein YbhN (UPF0104 family)